VAAIPVYNSHHWQQAETYTLEHPEQYEEQVNRFVHHIKHIWCQNDGATATYYLNWFASILQQPERKLQVALLVQGDHGAGKGIVAMLLRDIIGRVHFTHFTNLSDVLSRFNGIMYYGKNGTLRIQNSNFAIDSLFCVFQISISIKNKTFDSAIFSRIFLPAIFSWIFLPAIFSMIFPGYIFRD